MADKKTATCAIPGVVVPRHRIANIAVPTAKKRRATHPLRVMWTRRMRTPRSNEGSRISQFTARALSTLGYKDVRGCLEWLC